MKYNTSSSVKSVIKFSSWPFPLLEWKFTTIEIINENLPGTVFNPLLASPNQPTGQQERNAANLKACDVSPRKMPVRV